MTFTIKEIRSALHATQAEFAEELGISRVSLSDYENGKTEVPLYIQKAVDALYVLDDDGLPVFVDPSIKKEAELEIIRLRKEIEALKNDNEDLRLEVKKMDDLLEMASKRRSRGNRDPLPGIEGA
ncbi:MAG: helix-turn-helix transcriptional regulator [FCB group bacterium]|nr:helix-turn-helix transcriptional regulator [FCB group bacterium]MBL7027449.1 helix-turn-helix transcriptional regulator [Candidatus Neomarinimicrobiota bacterium]MBL7122062.1 helix-turn-helix transcriptional regulator [Candidatus Neomarinimicrobiota bacterium]